MLEKHRIPLHCFLKCVELSRVLDFSLVCKANSLRAEGLTLILQKTPLALDIMKDH
jgi:hypothetical protein